MEHLSASCFSLLMVVAGVGDVLSRRIPNVLCLLIALLFFPLALAAEMSWVMIGWSAATALMVLVAGFTCFHLGYLGGGDAKLLVASTLWFGFSGIAPFLAMTAIAGGVLTIIVAAGLLFGAAPLPNGLARPRVPYGFAIAAGAMLAAPGTWWGPDVPFWILLTSH